MDSDLLKTSLAETLDLPAEIIADIPVLTVYGKNELTIDNFKNIRDFTDKQLTVNTKVSKIIISGSDLMISCLTKETLIVKGNFKTLEFG